VVGVRGGVAIFQPRSVFIGYGEGEVRSGGATVTLSAGEYTQTLGGGAPPTAPSPPPANFLQSVLAMLQSQPGQGGGARATAGQVNNARTVASGSSAGTIATNLQNTANQTVTQSTTAPNLTQTIQTTVTQTTTQTIAEVAQPEFLTGFTAGMSEVSRDGRSLGRGLLVGGTEMRTDPANNRAQVNFTFANGTLQFGSTDPNLPSSSVTINGFDDVVGTTTALLPAVDRNGRPISTSNGGVPLAEQNGLLVEFRRGQAITASAQQSLGGTPFCDCDYTRWGFWKADVRHGGGSLRESIDAFWVAGRPTEKADVPTQGTASYVGHVAAQIQNGQSSYAASGAFRNDVNFGTRTGQFSVTNLDRTNYAGTVAIDQSDPRGFAGVGLSTNHDRAMVLLGNFFRGRTSPVGEMGGLVAIGGVNNNNSTYLGAGIFAGRRQ
jgi:hypothetical protein